MKNILVTGAGGTIGTEIAHRLAATRPDKLILLNHSEISLYNMQMSIRDRFPGANLTSVLADIRDYGHVRKIMDEHRPDAIFHAAAVKHVPFAEAHPIEAITTNIFGTLNLISLAPESRFVLISTDKAVYPSNVMGATKRVAEMICQTRGGVVVRFSNVRDSSGSVMPLFRAQIQRGGPVTVTHPEVRRRFISIREAVDLVLYGAAHAAHPNSVFVFDGEPAERIVDIAKRMIRNHGQGDIEIRFVGMRRGEKMYEELFYEWENPRHTGHENIRVGTLKDVDGGFLQENLFSLREACNAQDSDAALRLLAALVPEAELPQLGMQASGTAREC